MLDGVLELAHVAGPLVTLEEHGGFVAQVRSRSPGELRMLLDEVMREQEDVVAALAERGQSNGDDV